MTEVSPTFGGVQPPHSEGTLPAAGSDVSSAPKSNNAQPAHGQQPARVSGLSPMTPFGRGSKSMRYGRPTQTPQGSFEQVKKKEQKREDVREAISEGLDRQTMVAGEMVENYLKNISNGSNEELLKDELVAENQSLRIQFEKVININLALSRALNEANEEILELKLKIQELQGAKQQSQPHPAHEDTAGPSVPTPRTTTAPLKHTESLPTIPPFGAAAVAAAAAAAAKHPPPASAERTESPRHSFFQRKRLPNRDVQSTYVPRSEARASQQPPPPPPSREGRPRRPGMSGLDLLGKAMKTTVAFKPKQTNAKHRKSLTYEEILAESLHRDRRSTINEQFGDWRQAFAGTANEKKLQRFNGYIEAYANKLQEEKFILIGLSTMVRSYEKIGDDEAVRVTAEERDKQEQDVADREYNLEQMLRMKSHMEVQVAEQAALNKLKFEQALANAQTPAAPPAQQEAPPQDSSTPPAQSPATPQPETAEAPTQAPEVPGPSPVAETSLPHQQPPAQPEPKDTKPTAPPTYPPPQTPGAKKLTPPPQTQQPAPVPVPTPQTPRSLAADTSPTATPQPDAPPPQKVGTSTEPASVHQQSAPPQKRTVPPGRPLPTPPVAQPAQQQQPVVTAKSTVPTRAGLHNAATSNNKNNKELVRQISKRGVELIEDVNTEATFEKLDELSKLIAQEEAHLQRSTSNTAVAEEPAAPEGAAPEDQEARAALVQMMKERESEMKRVLNKDPARLSAALPPSFAATLAQPTSPGRGRAAAGEDVPEVVYAVFDFDALEEDELAFRVGDQISVLKQIDANWYLGELRGKRGIFPSAYVAGSLEELAKIEGGAYAAKATGVGMEGSGERRVINYAEAQPLVVEVLYDFDGIEDDEELSCHEGDMVKIIGEMDGFPEWIKAVHNGKAGWVPRSYLNIE